MKTRYLYTFYIVYIAVGDKTVFFGGVGDESNLLEYFFTCPNILEYK